jgi:alanine-synthesizing transaminase
MFSSRLDWNLRPNALSQLLEAKRRSGAEILDLTESNPTRAGFDYPGEEILRALSTPRALRYEPNPAGLPAAREAVAGYYRAKGWAVSPDQILLTASTSEAYALLFKLLADPGDEVLVPRPSYPLFEFLAALESVRPVPYPLGYHDGWSIQLDALEGGISPRTAAVILVNPNNPTGSFLKREELQRLSSICERRSLAILCDEVFSDYTFRADPARVPTLVQMDRVLTFCLSGLSKIAGLPQMKLGWIVVCGPSEARHSAMERLELIADTYLSVGAPVQFAAAELLTAGASVRQQVQHRVRTNLSWLQSTSGSGCPCSVLDVEGGWYAILRMPRTQTEEQWCLELLDKDSVLVQPGFFYDFESEPFLVVSLLTPVATFHEGLQRLFARAGSP